VTWVLRSRVTESWDELLRVRPRRIDPDAPPAAFEQWMFGWIQQQEELMADTGWEQPCQHCGMKVVDHVVYMEAEDIPENAVEGSFDSDDLKGFYCPPQSGV